MPPLAAQRPDRFATAAASGFGLVELRTHSPLIAQVLPSGALFAFRHDTLLLNQLLPGPAEDGLARLLLRWRAAGDETGSARSDGAARQPACWAPLIGSGVSFARLDDTTAVWQTEPLPGLACETRLTLHPSLPAWAWRIRLRNQTPHALRLDALHAQDLGLADEAAVRNNEAYTSQYIDLLPIADEQLGWVVLARQNQPASGGRQPWLALGCLQGGSAFCTDGWQFFGADHRLTGEPAALRMAQLPSRRLQYEGALAGLQSRGEVVPAGATQEIVFVARFVADHPAASTAADVTLLREALPGFADRPTAAGPREVSRPVPTLFCTAPWWHGDEPGRSELAKWFPESHRHVERDQDGRILSFFSGEHTHVVTRTKEAGVLRPHGHVLRSGDPSWNDEQQFGVTAYAAGIFAAQTYLGNSSLTRLLPVVRNALGLVRGSGQRVFVRHADGWRQLGLPSVFALTPQEVRWIYQFGSDRIEARLWCSRESPAVFLELQVHEGRPREFLVTHQLALGANEFEHPGDVVLHRAGSWIQCRPSSASLAYQQVPGTCFAIAAAEPASGIVLGGDELIWADATPRNSPYVALRTPAVSRCGIIQAGTTQGSLALPALVASVRAEFARRRDHSDDYAFGLKLSHGGDVRVARMNEVLPWFDQNASIHFSAPRGLEQYGGAAWGVRDVCQGSIEWLLASGRLAIARRTLITVFGQQYFGAGAEADLTGTWPQWFMFPPFQFIQHAHSHGDVCFWPVKALCDYVEASNDLAVLNEHADYTSPKDFAPADRPETIWAHCDRVIAHAESRFVAGTALVNYGDGDWDDTLQPADPAMRSRMISAWTVALSYQTWLQLHRVAVRVGDAARASRLAALLERIRADFSRYLMPAGIVAGFLVTDSEVGARGRPLLHPEDQRTGIRYRLLPMTRSILAELFTPAEAAQHLSLIEKELRYPDGVRLMSEPATYHGGRETLFKRADTAANVGREIGLQYVHAHLRYAEALAKLGEAERFWWALQVVNPVALAASVPHAAPRQSNVYFSSSDADFADRYEAAARWTELREGRVAVRGGWRLYSSGPGLFLHKVRTCLLGLRESFDTFLFDPVLPRELDGLVAHARVLDRPAELHYRVRARGFGPKRISLNGDALPSLGRETNRYRDGGLRVDRALLLARLTAPLNRVEIEL
ncbi:GH36-type glycosyl hydrolase domain-containing protein [Opitutus terrae]|uniref:Cellobiose phosphorylase n=1 Tax=Opitutus terrae (strain DSM 11246 / JCM 15787 / PB90-1) TaxID=452637 RepID=B1ZP04_OPITP|nr:hypothetical protein [Opitutus terrae]ACB77493.1 conserved hypothetical protein [Opitutus terrae PB90-1]